jgi:hypothetical protein
MGRRPLFTAPMTPTERMRRYRAAKRQAEIAAGSRPASKPEPLTDTTMATLARQSQSREGSADAAEDGAHTGALSRREHGDHHTSR